MGNWSSAGSAYRRKREKRRRIGGRQIELRQRNHLDPVEPDAGQGRAGTRKRPPTSTIDRLAGPQPSLGHALDVAHGDRVDPFREVLDLVHVQTVENRFEHLRGDGVRRLYGDREAAGQVVLRASQLPLAHAFAPQPGDLVHGQAQRFGGGGRPRVGLGHEVARDLTPRDVGGRGVGQRTRGAEHAPEPVAPLSAEDLDRDVERQEVRVRTRQGDVAGVYDRLHRPRPVDDDEPSGGPRDVVGGHCRRRRARLPVAERALHPGERLFRRDVSRRRPARRCWEGSACDGTPPGRPA